MHLRPAAAALATLLLAASCGEGERARHIALPVLADPSLPVSRGVELAEGPGCVLTDVASVGGRVTALLEEDDGPVWIGTFDGGVHRAARRGGPPHPGPLPPQSGGRGEIVRVSGLEDDGKGVRASDLEDGAEAVEFRGLAGRERFVNALAAHDGLVWVATQGGLLALDGDRRALALLEGEGVTALARAGGVLYAGTARGIFRVSAAEGAEPVAAAGPSGEPLRVTALAASATRLWIGTASGAYSLPLASAAAPLLAREARWHPLVFGEAPAETNVVTALAPVRDGAVAGTDDGGLVRLHESGRVVAVRFADPRANEVNPGAAAPDAAGAVVLGTQGGGLLLARTQGDGLAVVRAAGLGRAQVSAVARAGEALLVGTADGRVVSCAVVGGT